MIETARLTLSPYVADDAAALVRNVNCPEVASMLESVALPFTLADALARIELRQCDARRFTFAIRETATGEMIGEIAAAATEPGATPRMGYHIWPERWGKGYASEAVPVALGHAFGTLGWPQIDADAFDDNHASIRILQRASFERVGASTCGSQARDDDMTSSVFRLTRVNWATPGLTTARLTLRPYRLDDAMRVLELLNDYDVSRMLAPVAYPYTRELADEWVSGAIWDKQDLHWALDDGDGFIGTVSLGYKRDDDPQTGFWLGRRYWGKGYMTEAVHAVIDWAFSVRDDARLVSYAFVDNRGSQRVHEKAGFIPGDVVSHNSAARGEAVDAISYSLARSDWQARQ